MPISLFNLLNAYVLHCLTLHLMLRTYFDAVWYNVIMWEWECPGHMGKWDITTEHFYGHHSIRHHSTSSMSWKKGNLLKRNLTFCLPTCNSHADWPACQCMSHVQITSWAHCQCQVVFDG